MQSALTVHKSKHTGLKKLQCDWPGCDWRTNFRQQLDIHRQRTHEGKKVYLKRYTNGNVDPTAPFDAMGRPRPYRCEWPGCERRFRLECNLQPHLSWHQKGEGQASARRQKDPTRARRRGDQVFECDWLGCMARYDTSHSLLRLVISMLLLYHNRYTTRHTLKQHLNTHTGARPYSCKFCPESFAMRTQLRSHTISAHPGLQQNKKRSKPRTEHCEPSEQSSPIEDRDYSYVPQREVIRLNPVKQLNTLQIQTQNPMDFIMAYRRERMTPMTANTQTAQTAARKLVTNAKRGRTAAPVVSIDHQAIAQECPHPCPQNGCWRRFHSQRALEWHLKKFHPGFEVSP